VIDISVLNCIRVYTWLPAGSPIPSQYPLEPSRRFVTFPFPFPSSRLSLPIGCVTSERIGALPRASFPVTCSIGVEGLVCLRSQRKHRLEKRPARERVEKPGKVLHCREAKGESGMVEH
jgi:hypothetical protein